ncbi:Maf family protein [Cellulosilyticum sp. I15G10I2]|uniref:Maf family protein n=1 Tax=Cellulosilyticum sp. I15G10I2 TaxID=1892843 RepID=UPI00085C5D93|nr:Maf family protein [Cellulosilyticum sp. I15G10I2]
MANVLLASSSPRRQELMQLLDIAFEIVVKPIEEKIEEDLSPAENVKYLAFKKAAAVAQDYPEALVIGCDTVVVLNDRIIGKPKNPEDAKRILKALSGKAHYVCTGVAIINIKEKLEICFCETTNVKMKDLTTDEIDDYIATDEPLDKAGAYGIQGKGAIYIEQISGDYYNVVGLPLNRLYKELIKLNTYQRIKDKL